MVHAQRLENVLVDVIEVRLPGHALHNISSQPGPIVRIRRSRPCRKNARRQMFLQISVDRRQIFCITNKKGLDSFLESRRMTHEVAQGDWLPITSRNSEIEISLHATTRISL